MVILRQYEPNYEPMYEPKVFNDIDEIAHGREAKWKVIQRRQAEWTTRGGYMEHAKGSKQAMVGYMISIGFILAVGLAIGLLALMMK